jgi:hypothetical protein
VVKYALMGHNDGKTLRSSLKAKISDAKVVAKINNHTTTAKTLHIARAQAR